MALLAVADVLPLTLPAVEDGAWSWLGGCIGGTALAEDAAARDGLVLPLRALDLADAFPATTFEVEITADGDSTSSSANAFVTTGCTGSAGASAGVESSAAAAFELTTALEVSKLMDIHDPPQFNAKSQQLFLSHLFSFPFFFFFSFLAALNDKC